MKNNYVIEGNVVKVFFRTKEGFFLIDETDLEKIKHCTWYLNVTGYPSTVYHGKHTTLHRYLMGVNSEGKVVDHINRNKLDNRRSNLRFATISENGLNCIRGHKNTEKYPSAGIRYRKGKRVDTYKVEIHGIDDKTIYIGSYRTYKEAVLIRDTAFLLLDKGELTPFQIDKLRKSKAQT